MIPLGLRCASCLSDQKNLRLLSLVKGSKDNHPMELLTMTFFLFIGV